ncbi:transaldolase family protein [Alkalibacterium putridalgicola]|uniref:transaldolase family protein n=1 Tax=Alkalibacterium putridalgicola TaxID=426703 RepID=UPI0034CF4C45
MDTANLAEISQYLKYSWIDGVTTNPTLLRGEKKNRMVQINEILKIIGEKELFVQVSGNTTKEMIEDAESLIQHFGTKIILKIPADRIGFEAIEEIKREYPSTKILATAIFSVEQAYLAGLAGCEWIAPYINRMENQSLEAIEVMAKISTLYASQVIETKILGASFKNSSQVTNCLLAGAHDVTVPVSILDTILTNKLADDSIKVFNEHALEVQSY